MSFSAQHIKAARLHLQKSDPVMKAIIRSVGPFTARVNRDRFLTLVNSIVSQQISGAAARTIQSRLADAVSPELISPTSLSRFDTDQLRELGISQQKAGYLLDLSQRVLRGSVDLAGLHRRSDDDVITELVQVKGIGTWTAQMFLMFSLGRLDVFPVDDLGIRNGIKLNYASRGKLTTARMEKIARPWRPYATVASWYLWQSLDVGEKTKR